VTVPTASGAPPRQSDLEICKVHDRRELTAFLKVPWLIYANDPQWVPPLLLERREFLNPRKHPFYQYGSAVQFLARRQGRAVGRILVSDNPLYNLEHQTNTGCFGMFESIEDAEVASSLLDAAANWLRERGRDHIMGPIDYSTNYACGLLVDGFDTPQRVMMNHNPPYYQGLLEGWGLQKAKDLYAWWFSLERDLDTRMSRLGRRVAERGRITIRSLQVKDAAAEIRRCKALYDAAWEHNWGFVKMTDAEFADFAGHLLAILPPDFLLFAEVDGHPAGFCLTLPDFNEAIRPLNGRIFHFGLPLGLLRFRRNCRRIKNVRLIALGVLEEYRRRGVSELLILRARETGRDHLGITGAELGWTLEDNQLINNAIEASGGKRYKTYRIFEKSLR
jgi:GNAT superfamily N-acetyltransferase